MRSLLLKTALLIIERLPWLEIAEIIRQVAIKKLPAALIIRIDNLVAMAEDIPAAGPDKFRWVVEKLTGPDSSVRELALSVAGYLLNWAIESAVLRLKTRTQP